MFFGGAAIDIATLKLNRAAEKLLGQASNLDSPKIRLTASCSTVNVCPVNRNLNLLLSSALLLTGVTVGF